MPTRSTSLAEAQTALLDAAQAIERNSLTCAYGLANQAMATLREVIAADERRIARAEETAEKRRHLLAEARAKRVAVAGQKVKRSTPHTRRTT